LENQAQRLMRKTLSGWVNIRRRQWVSFRCLFTIEIKQVAPRTQWKAIFQDLSTLVTNGSLVYPKQVVDELKAGSMARGYDRPYEWAKKNSKHATRHGNLFSELTEVMSHPTASRVVDPNKSFGVEEADAYVLALAVHLKKNGSSVTVVTEESRSTPQKLALPQACGALRLYTMNVEVFLQDNGIHPKVAPLLPHTPPKPRRRKPN